MFNFFKKVFSKKNNLSWKRILIIEDNDILADMYNLKFKSTWFDVKNLIIGESNISLDDSNISLGNIINEIKAYNPSIILLDLMMPRISWYYILWGLKTEKLNYKVIVFSNLTDTHDKEKSLELGAVDFIVKSNVTPKELVERVKIYI